MANMKKACGNCGNNKRITDENGIKTGYECAIDNHNIGDVECMEGVCDRWKKDTIELKCCPCCNGTAKIGSPMNSYFISYVVKCEDCGLETRRFRTVAEAIEIWNTRKPMDRIIERLENVRRMMSEAAERYEYNRGSVDAYNYSIKLVREEGKVDEKS